MGFKIAAVSTGLLLIVTAGLWFFVQMQAKEQKETTEQINQLNAQNQEAMREVNQLRNTFQRHSLNNLAMAKPGLIENIINKGTAKVKKEFLELTRHSVNVAKTFSLFENQLDEHFHREMA